MTYSNNDSRINSKLVVPEERLKMIRELEQKVVEDRIRRRKEKRRQRYLEARAAAK